MDWLVFVSEQWLLVSLLVVMAAAFVVLESRRGGPTLGCSEVTRMLNAGDAVLIDLRDSGDYNAGHIVDAIHIPYAKLSNRADELEKYRDRTLILVDKMGQHAGAAGKTLREKGFTVYRVRGGMAEWQGQNMPVVKG